MFIKKNFKARHQLLGILFDHDIKQHQHTSDIKSKSIHFNDIAAKLPKYNKHFLLDNLDYLRAADEIYCSMQFDNSVFAIYSSGSHAYRDKKYIRDGYRDQFNYIYDIAKTVSIVVLLLIAIWTFVKNIYQTESNKKDIEQLRKELQDINNRTQQTAPPKK
jgi:hypothetical protein